MNSCAYDPNPNSFDCPPDSYHPPHSTDETYLGDSCGNDSQSGYDYPSESEGENGYDVPSCFTTFSNILFDDEYEFDSVDDQSLHNEDFLEKIFSNPLFEEEIICMRKNQHHFNAESDLVESMLNRDSSIISS
nr:hypothetical protein [Tanacetum cinerariifolium]